jgi:hypothetical protein
METQKLCQKGDYQGIAAYRTVGKVPPTLKNRQAKESGEER